MHSIKPRGKEKESGFTLVELAIVMIIIGLLITGILKGQEMIANAQVTSTISQVKGLDAALSTFRDKYRMLPGDMRDPSQRLANCTQAPCSRQGNGNGRIDSPALGNAPNANQEGGTAFVHMAASDLISGVSLDDGTRAFGVLFPEASIGGGFFIGYTSNGSATGLSGNTLRSGHYLVLNGVSNQPAGGPNGVVSPSQALQMDNKMDDGSPDTGAVQGDGSGCRSGSDYDTANDTGLCSLFIRVQG